MFSLFTQFSCDYLSRSCAKKSDLARYLHYTYIQAFQLSHLCSTWKSHLTVWIPIWVRSETSHQSRDHLFTPRQATELWHRVTQHHQTRQLIPSERAATVPHDGSDPNNTRLSAVEETVHQKWRAVKCCWNLLQAKYLTFMFFLFFRRMFYSLKVNLFGQRHIKTVVMFCLWAHDWLLFLGGGRINAVNILLGIESLHSIYTV